MRQILLALIFFSTPAFAMSECEIGLVNSLKGLVEMALREGVRTPEQIRKWVEAESPSVLEVRQGLTSVQLPIARGLGRASSQLTQGQWSEVQTQVRSLLAGKAAAAESKQEAQANTAPIVNPQFVKGWSFDNIAIEFADLGTTPDGKLLHLLATKDTFFLLDDSQNTLLKITVPRKNRIKGIQLTFFRELPLVHVLYDSFEKNSDMVYQVYSPGEQKPFSTYTFAKTTIPKLYATPENAAIVSLELRKKIFSTVEGDTVTFDSGTTYKFYALGSRQFFAAKIGGKLYIYENANGKWHKWLEEDSFRSLPHLLEHDGNLLAITAERRGLHIANLTHPEEPPKTLNLAPSAGDGEALDSTVYQGRRRLVIRGIKGILIVNLNPDLSLESSELISDMSVRDLKWFRGQDGSPILVGQGNGHLLVKEWLGAPLTFDFHLAPSKTNWAQTPDNIYYTETGNQQSSNVYRIFNGVKP